MAARFLNIGFPGAWWWAVAPALLSGVLLWLSTPSMGVGWLGWVALVPAATVALSSAGTRSGRLAIPLTYMVFLELMLVPALPFGLTRNQWGDPVIPVLVGESPVLVVALVAIPFVGLLLYAIGFPHPWPPRRGVARTSGFVLVLAPALTWTAFDLVRTKFDPSGFWGPLFLSQHDTEAARIGALAGPWLLTFAIVAVNYTLALLVVRRRRASPVLAGTAAFGLALVVAIVATEAAARDHSVPISVAAVQPGYDTADFELPVLRYMRRESRNHELASLDLIEDLAPLTREAASRGAEIVVWPEAVVWVDPHRIASVRDSLTRLSNETRAALVVPFFLRARGHGAAVVVTPGDNLSVSLPKQRPMWFLGENGDNRVPAASVETGSGALGTMLGVDNQEPAPARTLTGDAADVLSSSTHDWKQLAPVQSALTQLHARSLRTPIVRADWRYGSALFDRDGTRLADAGRDKRRTVLVAQVRARSSSTPYQDVGDTFGWGCAAAALVLWAAGRLHLRLRASAAPRVIRG